jgi:transposase InsO family protein
VHRKGHRTARPRRRGRGAEGERYQRTRGRGRPRKELSKAQRGSLLALHRAHPDWGLPKLRDALPGLPRNSALAYLRRYKRLRRKRHRRRQRVQWHLPGTVWAIDGTWLEQRVVGSGRRALIVVEMHTRKTLALESVAGERAYEVERVLAALVEKHGAPLVLKLDNGSAFISLRILVFCALRGITLMHSPVRRPSWNGTCEVSGRWAKRRAQAAAEQRGDDTLTQADLDAAVTYVGVLPKVDEALRRRFLAVVAEQLEVVARERGVALDEHLRDHVHRSLGRVAARRALQACHILTIEGRGYRQWFLGSAA